VTGRFRIEALTAQHKRNGFSCGVPALDRYLSELASQDIKRRVSNCFVVADEEGTVAAYYTFAATSVPLGDLPPEMTKRLPRYALLPAGLIGRLAVDERHKGKKWGGAMILDAVSRSMHSAPAIFAIIVDAKDDTAAAFYEHLGFRRFVSRPLSLYLPVATAIQAFGL